MQESFNIFYFIDIYKKWWKIILTVVLIAMFLAMVSSLLKPRVYVSKLTLITQTGKTAATSSLGNLLGIEPSFSNDIIIAILKSKRMSQAINDKFKLEQRHGFWWGIDTFRSTAGLGVIVKGSDPKLIQRIANFSVENLDVINAELNITPNKPMVTVLDPATYGGTQSRGTSRKMVVAGMFSFLALSSYILLLDYFRRLKRS